MHPGEPRTIARSSCLSSNSVPILTWTQNDAARELWRRCRNKGRPRNSRDRRTLTGSATGSPKLAGPYSGRPRATPSSPGQLTTAADTPCFQKQYHARPRLAHVAARRTRPRRRTYLLVASWPLALAHAPTRMALWRRCNSAGHTKRVLSL